MAARSPAFVTYRGERFPVALRPEFLLAGRPVWSIEISGAWYQLGPQLGYDSHQFFRTRMRSKYVTRTPAWLASRKYPLLLLINGVAIRAWSQFVARGTGASTYVHPLLNQRVGTVKPDPAWMFESAARPASACGSKTPEQTLDDVVDLATIWLRSGEARSGS